MRPSEAFVRPLAHEEALRSKRLVKRSKHASTRERASIVLGLQGREFGGRDRGELADRPESRAQGDPRVQRARFRFVAS